MTCLANAIELRNITKRFGQVVANKSISLELHKGEILSLLGENGSGKTTLMNMLSGIYFPDEKARSSWMGRKWRSAPRRTRLICTSA